ncbi:hypothetical protein B0H14DRAFT_3467228 [Mycena olivaceomarginata]|nr:hypothetical protein B0H14DRAFT_3467228 [Mycena olivaceomarginata]
MGLAVAANGLNLPTDLATTAPTTRLLALFTVAPAVARSSLPSARVHIAFASLCALIALECLKCPRDVELASGSVSTVPGVYKRRLLRVTLWLGGESPRAAPLPQILCTKSTAAAASGLSSSPLASPSFHFNLSPRAYDKRHSRATFLLLLQPPPECALRIGVSAGARAESADDSPPTLKTLRPFRGYEWMSSPTPCAALGSNFADDTSRARPTSEALVWATASPHNAPSQSSHKRLLRYPASLTMPSATYCLARWIWSPGAQNFTARLAWVLRLVNDLRVSGIVDHGLLHASSFLLEALRHCAGELLQNVPSS